MFGTEKQRKCGDFMNDVALLKIHIYINIQLIEMNINHIL